MITSHLVKFTLVTRIEDVNDDMITLGCKVALVMFPTTDVTIPIVVTFNLTELDDDTRMLEN